MKIKNKIININKDIIKRKNFTKYEIKKIILKSVIQNKNIKPLIRVYAFLKLSQFKLKFSISKQNNNICLYTGKIKSVLKLIQFSRQIVKKISISGNLQNIKIISW